jgi:hypothetical protein
VPAIARALDDTLDLRRRRVLTVATLVGAAGELLERQFVQQLLERLHLVWVGVRLRVIVGSEG